MYHGLLHPARWPSSAHLSLTGPILVAVLTGVLTRALLLQLEQGPFPTRPHGRLNYLFLGLVGAILGALAPPALLTANYTAGVFLGLGLSQFHTVRQIERTMLLDLDRALDVPRGHALIEATTIALETRNYLVILVAIASSFVGVLFGWGPGMAVGLLVGLAVTTLARRGDRLGRHAVVTTVSCRLEGGRLWLGPTGEGPSLPAPARLELDDLPSLVALRLTATDDASFRTLGEHGQRQAVLHHLAWHLGVRRVPRRDEAEKPAAGDGSEDEPLGPRTLLDARTRALYVLFFAEHPSPDAAVRAAAATPLVETVAHPRL